MQKVIRRSILAETQAVRRKLRKKDKCDKLQRKTEREHERLVASNAVADIKNARTARREDWELGPLAPKRDVGSKKESYGTIDTMRMQGRVLSMEERMKVNPIAGRYANIVPGDRVVLLEGPDKGRIGKMIALDRRRQECTVESLNMIDVVMPQWMLTNEADKRPVRSMEKPVPLSAVKLVYPLPDHETGTVRDVVVKKLINGPIFYDRHTGRKQWSRIIPGLDIKIPWPTVEPKVQKDFDADTLRIDVEAKTFVPSLLKQPMPGTVIDELRNKFSKFRTRHDESYIEAKMKEDEEAAKKDQLAAEMRTPLNELNRKLRKEKKSKGKPVLSREMLIRIGETIAKKRDLSIGAAGLEKETITA